jgi:WD40 repeat protein/serine/threonine protein kinase
VSEPATALPPEVHAKVVAVCERVRGQLGVEIAALCRRYGRFANQIWQVAETLTGLRRTGEVEQPKAASKGNKQVRGGTYIGPYRVVKPLGKGGMGVVYLAEQTEPVKREVAVKVIRAGVDLDQVLSRFALEQQALAVMNHRSIARVFEAGETSDGAPYFVMEYVPGVPIDEYCENKALSLADRLVLFQQVCGGVQHAHQKGVIHRDLTARNVMVTEEEGKPVPKIIDFGLARATDLELVQQSMCTEAGLVVGTPEYMSPEQINPGQDVDTRTDVYSLGVLLYNVLTGSLPFPSEALRRGGFAELQRMIVEQDPPRPSLTVELLDGEAAQQLAQRRQCSPHHLLQQLRSDLDWIVLKCLEKDRNQRYETPSELSNEIGRYLADEPLTAGPPSAGYRLRKLMRRHKRRVIAAAAVAAALIAGMLGTTHGLLTAKANASVAEANAEHARAEKEEADRQRERANQNALYLGAQSERLRHQTILALAGRQLGTDPWLALAFVQEVPAHSEIAAASLQVAHDALSACDGPWRCRSRLLGHEGRLTSLAISPDGQRILTASRDGSVRIWKGEADPVVLVHPDEVTLAMFTPGGLGVLTGCRDGVLRLWGTSGGDRAVAFTRDTNLPHQVVFDLAGERFVTLAPDGLARVFDVRRPAADLRSLATQVSAVAFSPDGQRLLLLSQAGHVRLLPANGEGMERDVRHDAAVHHACFAPDGSRVLTASADGSVRLTPVENVGAQIILRHPGPVAWGAYAADGTVVLTLGQDHIVRTWSAQGGGVRASYQDGDVAVVRVTVSADGLRFATLGADHVVRVWDATRQDPPLLLRHDTEVKSAQILRSSVLTLCADRRARVWDLAAPAVPRPLEHPSGVEAVAHDAEGKRIVTAAANGSARVWQAEGTRQPVHAAVGSGNATVMALSTDAEQLAIGSDDGHVSVFTAATGALLARLTGHRRPVRCLVFSPDGKTLASGADDGTVRCTSLHGAWPASELAGHSAAVAGIAFSPDGHYVASAAHDGTARLWQRDGSQQPRVLHGHGWHVVAVAFSPDGGTVATASWDGSVRLWPMQGEAEPIVLRHPDKVHAVTFSPDGRHVATACEDAVARVFAVDGTGSPVRLQGHTRAVRTVNFGAGGNLVVTASADHTVRVWSREGAGPPLVLRGHADEVASAELSPDGQVVISASLDQTARIWRVDGAQQPLTLRHNAPLRAGSFRAATAQAVTLTQDGARVWCLDWQTLRAWLHAQPALALSPTERGSFAVEELTPALPPR